MGYFDAIDVKDSNGVLWATLQRDTGPLETGWYDHVTQVWMATSGLTPVDSEFGVDSSGTVYFDTNGPAPGEEADLLIDPQAMQMIFLSGADRLWPA